MKERLIGFIFVIAVLSALFMLTGGDTDNKQTKPLQTQPQTKFNF